MQMLTNVDPPTIVAEISCNHLQDIDLGYKLLDLSKRAGADWAKIQLYRPNDMVISSNYYVEHCSGTPWDGMNLRDLYNQAYTPVWMAEAMFRYAARKEIKLFSSVFSEEGLEELERMGCPMYKIASFENNDYDLINKVSRTGKKIIVSLGTMQDLGDAFKVKDAVENPKKLILMHCISAYPTYDNEAHVTNIPKLRHATNLPVGFSDHTQGNYAAMAATALGACMIEKHLSSSGDKKTLDEGHNVNEYEFGGYSKDIRAIHKTLISTSNPEAPYRQFKRSLYATGTIEKGEIIDKDSIRAYRPYLGLDPVFLPSIIGKRAARQIQGGSPILLDDIEGFKP